MGIVDASGISASPVIYDPETGVFTSRKTGRAFKAQRNGYTMVTFNGRSVAAHRLAWFLSSGEWPNGEVHHKNGLKTDNRISNLECVSPSEHRQRHAIPALYPKATAGRTALAAPVEVLEFPRNRRGICAALARILGLRIVCETQTRGVRFQVIAASGAPVSSPMPIKNLEAWLEEKQIAHAASEIALNTSTGRSGFMGPAVGGSRRNDEIAR